MKKRQPNTHLTMDELEAVMTQARKESTRNWCMCLVAYYHGLRSKELAELKVSDIHHGQLHVQRCKGSLETHQDLTKRKGNPLMDEVKALKAWMAERNSDSTAPFTSGNLAVTCTVSKYLESSTALRSVPGYQRTNASFMCSNTRWRRTAQRRVWTYCGLSSCLVTLPSVQRWCTRTARTRRQSKTCRCDSKIQAVGMIRRIVRWWQRTFMPWETCYADATGEADGYSRILGGRLYGCGALRLFLGIGLIYTRKFRVTILAIIAFGAYLAWEGIKTFREEKRNSN